MSLLSVENLSLSIRGKPILKEVDFRLEPGRITGLVGESGSGKSLTALSIMQLLPSGSRATGSIRFNGQELLDAGEETMCALRGDDIGMVFQEPMTALNPLKTIGEQVAEGIRIHAGASDREAQERAAAILDRVGLPRERFPLSRFPHELSGGQRQRVVIAMACAMRPKLLIADEPTTALDVLVQARILELLRELVAEDNMAMLFISHDLGVVAELADDIVVMRRGEVKEAGPAVTVLKNRKHPYTAQLAEASSHIPAQSKPWHSEACDAPLLAVENLICEYPGHRMSLFAKSPPFRAVDDVSFEMQDGEILGLVGESGCGKSTLSRAILGLMRPVSGKILSKGEVLNTPEIIDTKGIVHLAQAVFQDPYGSFNPRHTAERLVAEPLFLDRIASRTEKRGRVVEALESVGLAADDLGKYPHEFSGGQRQRLAIARAIVNHPRLIVADEPVSALDVSIRAQILDLIVELRERKGLAWLFISHDLSVVHALCDTVMVMQHGKIVEAGPARPLYAAPKQAYTKELISAAPDLDAALKSRLKSAKPERMKK
ncbi:MAG: ABC transporter ATP-binding protein [Nitratireductor sp.]|nr:ABC transporter ATP-binding protein [Nitratireductor sp.]